MHMAGDKRQSQTSYLRPGLHEQVFNENATIVLHLHIVFVSSSCCSLWRPFSKVIIFSRFSVDAR